MTLLIAALAFGTFSLTRLILLVSTGPANVSLHLWPIIMAKGLVFDAAVLAYLLPPFVIIDLLLPVSIRERRWFTIFRCTFLGVTIFLLLFLNTMEIIFWSEFHTRFNFIALDYLIYTHEVLNNIWQSYPVIKICFGLALLSGISAVFLHKRFASRELNYSAGRKWKLVGLAIGLPSLSVLTVGLELMYHQGNALAEELTGNGLFTLAAAARHNELDYDRFYATIPQDKANRILKNLGVEWTDDLYRREYDMWGDDRVPHPLPSFMRRRPRHVVLISVESLSAKFVGAYGSTDGLTPYLDQLAREGYLFERVYATGTRTVRGLEALTLATPPIPGQAIIRRPGNAGLASVGEMLHYQGVELFFLYGGHGYFDNMNKFFSANAYKVYDRTDIPEEMVVFENAWGVADEVLYNKALQVLDHAAPSKKQLFAHIMTTSNHRPYTYPKGRIDIPSPGGRRGAVKYTDYAIGEFIKQAQTRPWFKETLFVIVADHCASVSGRTELPVADYQIPLILYGPGLVKPGRSARMISQIDIAPTLFDILGMAGDDNFFGKEVVEQKGPPRAFISNYQNLGYYKNDQLIVLKPKQKVEAYRVDPVTFESTPTTAQSELVDEAIAYYQTASRAYKEGKLKLLWKREDL